jgi:hypothetical protein
LAARTRQQSKKKANDGKAAATATRGSRRKHFNLETYKFHSLGDYAASIRLHGTRDSYSTQLVYLLARLLELDRDGTEQEFSDEERATIIIKNNRLFCHQVLRINFTTYDNQWSQDTINPRTRPDIMMLSGEDHDDEQSHPYWYARVIEIFHTRVLHISPHSKSLQPQRMEFLLVRWFGHHVEHYGGWKARHLHHIAFVDADPGPSFRFVDPSRIIRAGHLIPAFTYFKTTNPMKPSKIGRRDTDNDEDWCYYYVAMYVLCLFCYETSYISGLGLLIGTWSCNTGEAVWDMAQRELQLIFSDGIDTKLM